MKQDKNNCRKKSAKMTLLFSALYFIIGSISFTIVIWIRYLIYKSSLFSTNHVPSHTSTIIFAGTSIIIGTFISVFVAKKVLGPLQNVLIAMSSVADGDYSVRVEPNGTKRFKHLGQSFNNMIEEINSAEILKKDFINDFSHEFKTPITSIKGFAKILKENDSLSQEEKEEYLDIIIDESERLAAMSQSILALSRLENQSITTNIEEINVSEQIRMCVALFDQRLAEKNIALDFESDEYNLSGNASLLKQAWVNLIDNAIKFSPEDSKIRVSISRDNDELVVSFSNHGEKLDETAEKRIFDKFYQVDKSRKTVGNGLGLTLVKKIITNHDGRISVTSDDEYEIVFNIYLPYR